MSGSAVALVFLLVLMLGIVLAVAVVYLNTGRDG